VSNTGTKNSKALKESAHLLKCWIEDLVPNMKKAIDEGGKEKIVALEKQKSLDQI
jgi:hypothetical protein